MRQPFLSSLLSYSIAVLSVIAAALLTWSLWALMQRSIFLFFLVAVMISAWRGGHGPGVVAAILGVALSDYFFISPIHSLLLDRPEDAVPLFVFFPVALLVSILTAESNRTRWKLTETSETLKAMIQASPLAIVAAGKDGKIRTWNSAAERMFGWTASEILGTSNTIVPEETLDEFHFFREQTAPGTVFRDREVDRFRKNGSHINVSLSMAEILDSKGDDNGVITVITDVTARKLAVEALQESEQRFRATFEQAAVGIVEATREGRMQLVNQRFCNLLGYTRAELLEMCVADVTRPCDVDSSLRNMEQVWTGETPTALIEKFYVRKDGLIVSANLSLSVVRDASGNPMYFIGAIEDTTERKRAEEALRESEERFRAIFEHAAVGIAQISLDGKWLMVNQKLCAILGYTQDELLDQTFHQITHADDLDGSFTGRAVLLAGEKETYTLEKRYLRKDNSLVWTRLSVSLVRDSSGNPEYFLSVTEDITERKQAEQALLRLATAVEQAAESIVITDTDGVIKYVNPAFERTTGYSRDEVIGRTPQLLRSGKQDPVYYAEMWDTIKRGDVWTGHFTNRKKDGTLFEEEATISPVRDGSGNLVNYVAVKRDVTKEVGLENQLMQAQKMEAIGTLAGGVAHDFNNLLTVIIGYSQFGLSRLNKSDPLYAEIKEIEDAGVRAAALTSQLLAFSRKQVFQPRILDLNMVVTDLKKMLRRLIGEDIDLTAVLNFELGSVKADPGQLQQVIMNLAVNARDAMPNGGKLTIETSNVTLNSDFASRNIEAIPGDYVMITVSDDGCGMDEETRSHIFEPFFTTKEFGRGTGLGLSTVYGIVKQSGGFVLANSELGQGTIFKVYLPRVADSVKDDYSEAERSILRGGSETLLLVEDETSVRDLAARALKEFGYTVLEASNGAQALCILDDGPGDVVQMLVTDVVMPLMGGCDLAEELALSRPDLPILFLSGYTDKAIVHRDNLNNVAPFLQKPFTTEALVRKVREILDDARQQVACGLP